MCFWVQGRARLPVTLVLGMAISVAALRHMLPAKAADVLQAREFRLVQVKSVAPRGYRNRINTDCAA